MTIRFTQDEWITVIEGADKNLPLSKTFYEAPDLGTEAFAKCIDHTLLKLNATKEQIDVLCEEAKKYNFKSVCVRLNWVVHAMYHLFGSSVIVACVIGFHEGTHSTSEKVREAKDAVRVGAKELDMVLNYVQLKEKRYSEVYTDIAAVRSVAPHPVILKVILETAQLSRHEIIAGCKIAEAAGADFVKTSTGFNGPGATENDVRLMRSVVGQNVKVKASGGVKTVGDCIAMVEAGAERIGASSGVSIMEEARKILEDVTLTVGEENRRSQKPTPASDGSTY